MYSVQQKDTCIPQSAISCSTLACMKPETFCVVFLLPNACTVGISGVILTPKPALD